MCGIAGVWTADRGAGEAGARAMVAAQAHRGPDDAGLETLEVPTGFLVLGHRRLSIQDLSPAGHQPMVNLGTGDWVVFNGEVYNFPELRAELEAGGASFRSHCDTEVILHAFARWGTDAFDRLHGMFALGIYDRGRRRLVLARDPLGIKPLYYAWGRGAFVFASEVRAVEASGLVDREVDRRALAGLFAYGAVQGPLTIFRDVRLLEPGTWAALDLTAPQAERREPRVARFWDFPPPGREYPAGRVDVDEVRDLLMASVRSHLISDVPVGVFLSSGLDSTALAALCAEARGGDLDTFTISRAGDREFDEGPAALETARLLGVRHHEIELTEGEARRLAGEWLGSLDQPSVDGLNTYIISHAVRARGIIVALSGLGGDETFAGYSTFRDVPRLIRLAGATRGVPRAIRTRVAHLALRGATRAQRQKGVEMAGARANLANFYFRRRRLLSDAEMGALGLSPAELGLDENFMPPECEPGRGLPPRDPVASVGVLESRFYMGNMLLRDSDVFGMAHGLEIRIPLLDRRLSDLAYSVPGASRVNRGGPNKPLLAGAMRGRIRPELLALKKRGFSLPQARWMAGPLREQFEGRVDAVARSGLVDPSGVRAVWQSFLDDPEGPTWSRAWLLGSLGSWLERGGAPLDGTPTARRRTDRAPGVQ